MENQNSVTVDCEIIINTTQGGTILACLTYASALLLAREESGLTLTPEEHWIVEILTHTINAFQHPILESLKGSQLPYREAFIEEFGASTRWSNIVLSELMEQYY